MNIDRLIQNLEEFIRLDCLGHSQREKLKPALNVVKAYQAIHLGEDTSTKNKVQRARHRMEKLKNTARSDTQFVKGYKQGLTKSISILEEEFNNE